VSTTPNVFESQWDEQQDRPPFSWRRARLGRQAGGCALGVSLYELPPGSSSFPLHVHHANEEMLIVLAGYSVLRTLEGMGGEIKRRYRVCERTL
jgi:uncharacterized cupin superfamily protein